MQDYLIYLIKTLKNKGIYSSNISYIKNKIRKYFTKTCFSIYSKLYIYLIEYHV